MTNNPAPKRLPAIVAPASIFLLVKKQKIIRAKLTQQRPTETIRKPTMTTPKINLRNVRNVSIVAHCEKHH